MQLAHEKRRTENEIRGAKPHQKSSKSLKKMLMPLATRLRRYTRKAKAKIW